MTDWKALARKRQTIIAILERRYDQLEAALRAERIISSEALKALREIEKEQRR